MLFGIYTFTSPILSFQIHHGQFETIDNLHVWKTDIVSIFLLKLTVYN
jgi:hypothetical protein